MKILQENVSKQEVKEFLYYGMSYEDKQLYQQVNESQANIFQFSGNTASGMIQRAVPQNFDELTCLNALSRPGSSFSFDDFVANGTEGSKYPEAISKFLKDSHGCILFQEEIMKLVEDLSNGKIKGNYARGLLKKLGKANKKQEDLDAWDKLVNTIKEEAKSKLTTAEIDEFTADLITLSAYSFNKSHAAAYTYVACETLYMSRYFKPYFWAASLTYDATKNDVIKDSIKSAQKNGFKILPPDVNSSNLHFTPISEKEIRFGLNEIKGVGEEPAKNIIDLRGDGYKSIIEFIIKTLGTKVNKRITLALIGGGAFDDLIPEGERKKYLKITEQFYVDKKTSKNPDKLREVWEKCVEDHYLDGKTSNEEYMEMEKNYLSGSFFHGVFNPEVNEKIEKLYSLNKALRTFAEVREEDRSSAYVPVYCSGYRYHVQKNGLDMCFLTCEDMSGETISIPVFASYWEFVKIKFFGEGYYLIKVFPKEDGQIMFGSRNYLTSADSKRQCMLHWKIK